MRARVFLTSTLVCTSLGGCVMSREAGVRLETDMQALRGQVSALSRTVEQLKAETTEERQSTTTKLQNLHKSFETTDLASRTNDADFTTQLERMTHEVQELRGALEDSEHRLSENQTTLQHNFDERLSSLQQAAAAEAQRRKQSETEARLSPNRRKEALRDGLKMLSQPASRAEGRTLLTAVARKYGKERGVGDEAHFALGQAALADKAWEAALNELVLVVDFNPPSRRAAEAYFMIGQASEGLGRTDDAKTFYAEVIGHFPSAPQAKQARQRLSALGGRSGRQQPADTSRPAAVGPAKKP